MTDYLIYRHGSNAANQSMTPVMAVGIVTAESEEAAKQVAGKNFNCYNNQYLSAVSFEECDAADWNEIVCRDAQLRDCGEQSIIFS